VLLLTLPFSPHRLFDWNGDPPHGGEGSTDIFPSVFVGGYSRIVAEGFDDNSHILGEEVSLVVYARTWSSRSRWHHLQETRSADIN